MGVPRHTPLGVLETPELRGESLPLGSRSVSRECLSARLAHGIDELHADYRGREGTVWRGENAAGDRVFVRSTVDSRNTMKEVLAYRLAEALELPYVPLTVPVSSMPAVFFRDGRCLGSGCITASVQLEIPNAVDIVLGAGVRWIDRLPAALTLFEGAALGADPNASNHLLQAVTPVARPEQFDAESLFSDEYPGIAGTVMRIDWEQAFDIEQFRLDPVTPGVLNDARLSKALADPQGQSLMDRLERKPRGWISAMGRDLPVDASRLQCWVAAIESGIGHLCALRTSAGM